MGSTHGLTIGPVNRQRNRDSHVTHQQAVGTMYGDTAGETVMDGQVLDIGGRVIASSLVHISVHVEVYRVVTQRLLSHVHELHPLDVHCFKTMLHLKWREN